MNVHQEILSIERQVEKDLDIIGRTGFEPVTNGLKGHCSTN